jgi:hypothetical protein
VRRSTPLLAFAWLAVPAMGACSFDVDSFHTVARDGAVTDGGAEPDVAADGKPGDTGGDTRTSPIDTGAPPSDVGGDADDPVAAACKAKGPPGVCLDCCGEGYPKGRSAVVKHTEMCLCTAANCAAVCDKTFCKPGAPKTPDEACAACLRDALAGACSGDADAARTEEPQATPYLGCAIGCR